MKKTILMIMGAAMIFGCGTKKTDVSKLVVGDWEIVEAGGSPVESGFDKATISFDAEGGVHGNTSINYFFGEYTVKDDALEFGNVGLTKMMGPTPDTERAVLDGLNRGVKISFEDNDNAVIFAKDGTEVLKLKRTEIKEEDSEDSDADAAESADAGVQPVNVG